MKIKTGYLYFVSNDFFDVVQDPYLKINYTETRRPHYFAFEDNIEGLYWFIPCSSKIDKYEKIINKKKKNHKPSDSIKIVKIFDNKSVLLLQDMFPITEKYISEQYFKGGQPVSISDPKTVKEIEKSAKKIVNLLRRGVKFSPTQVNVNKIEKIMIDELKQKL